MLKTNKSEKITQKSLEEKLDKLKKDFESAIAAPLDMVNHSEDKYISFSLNEETYAWPVKNLREILSNQLIVPIPYNQDKLHGVINYKNQVLPVTNMHSLLGLNSIKSKSNNIILVTKGLPIETSLFVGTLKALLLVAKNDIKPKTTNHDNSIAQLIIGEFYQNGELITILNPDSII